MVAFDHLGLVVDHLVFDNQFLVGASEVIQDRLV